MATYSMGGGTNPEGNMTVNRTRLRDSKGTGWNYHTETLKNIYDRHIKGVSKKVNKTHEQMSNLEIYRNSSVKNAGRKKLEQSAQDLQDKIKSITYVMSSR